jgi:pimeloyl-ACP methyl ester carboxylesterase
MSWSTAVMPSPVVLPRAVVAERTVPRLVSLDRYLLRLGTAEVWVERYRPSEPRSGAAPVVFLHGWGMSPGGYRAGLEEMAMRGVRVDAFSLPGYAQSSPLPVRACSISDHAAHLADAIEQAGFDLPVHLAGHSFGGGIALRIAATRPDLVDRVTLSCPIGGAGAGPPSWTGMGRSLLFDGGLRGVTNFARSLAPALARHSVQVVLSGLQARRADLVADVHQAVGHGVDLHLILADSDLIAPPGELASPVPGVRISSVTGQHNWPHVHPRRWAELTVG